MQSKSPKFKPGTKFESVVEFIDKSIELQIDSLKENPLDLNKSK
jgi:hypothetical protein